MATIEQDIKAIIETIKTQRDELKVRMHLANAEINDEWVEMGKKWEEMKTKNSKLKASAGDTSVALVNDLKKIGKDLKEGYERMKKTLH